MKHISIITILLLAAFSLSAHEIKDGVLYISDGTTEIRGQAFAQNGKFSKVIIPKSVTKIGDMAFMKCRNLKEIEIPSSVKYIGKAAFQMCTSLEKLTLHDGVEQIQFRAFKSTSLRSVSLPKSVKTVGGEAFADCKKLNKISVVKYSMPHTFFVSDQRLAFSDDAPANTYDEWIDASLSLTGKSFLENGILHIHPSRTEIKNQQYAMKTNFTKVILPPTITKIGNMAFMKCYNLKEIEIPPSVKHIGNAAFQLCTSLEKVTLHDGLEKLSFRLFKSSAIKQIEIPSTVKFIYDEVFADCKNLMVFTDRRTNIMDISPKYEIPDNFTIPEGMRLRVKAGSAADKWAVRKGLFLCGVLSCFNEYSADKSLAITEDFTRILGDDESWFDRTGYSFEIKKPLKIEEIDGNIVLTSFMLKPCRNVTVTVGGTQYMDRKTIQPLTRTVICNAAGVDVGSISLTTDDPLYKILSSIPVNWTISFDGFVRQPSTPEKNFTRTNRPVFCRQWIQNIYNLAYTIGSDEYRDQCMESAKNRWLVTDEAQTKFLTEDEMEALYKKATNWKLRLGRCGGIAAGLGGGYFLALDTTMLMNIAACTRAGLVSGFFHELSHCMGYGHKAGNMCNQGAKNGYGEKSWQMIGGKIYVKQFKNGEVPYTLGRQLLNGDFFCSDQYNLEDPKNDIVKNRTLYIADGMPYTVSHKNQTDFTGIEFPLSVQKISSQAFCNTKVQRVAFPKSLRKIDKSAFQNCVYIKNIDIPDTVKAVGDGAFQNCTSLESVKIGKGMRQLNTKLFKSTALREVTIPKNIQYIGKEAFTGCRNLTSVTIENGVRKIGDNAFDGTAIMELTIPESVTMIGKNITSKYVVWDVKEGSYAYKFALENNIPIKKDNGTLADNAARILNESKNAELAPNDSWTNGTFTSSDVRRMWDFSDYLNKGEGGACTITFTYTSGRHGFDITDALFTADGKGIAYFPEKRFAGHSPSKFYYTVKVPAGTKKFEMFALARGDGGIDSNGMITVNNPDLRKLVIPQSTEVIKSSFYFGANFEEVILPQGLKKIENNAFQNCPNLKSIDIPDSVTEMGSAVFQYCSSLETVKIGSGIKKINNTMFNHSGLKNVYLSDSLTGIGKEAFANCANLAQIIIPNAVTDMGDSAFQNCVSLTKAKIGTGLTALNASVFKNTGLTDITIPDNVTVIGSQAFQNCKNLKKVEIGSSVTKIDKSAFEKTAVEAINIPDTVTDVGKNAFSSCASLTAAKLGKGLTELSSAVFQGSGLKEITIPKNVVTVADKAFQNCKNLKKVVIGSGVTKIGKSAFEKTCLTNITIPKNVELIDEKAFQDCKSLENVIIENGVKQIGWRAFNGTAIKEIKIPASVKSIGQSIVPKNTYWDVEPGTYAYKFAMDNKFLIKPSEKEVKEKTAQILQQSSNIESAPADKWAKGMFTKSDVLRKWDFSEMLDGTDGGDYVIRFTYSEGSDILRLTDSLFIADGNPIGYFPQMMSVGSNDREAAFNITVPKGTEQLEMFALARAGKSDNSGTISVLMKEDDETIEDDEDDDAAETEDLSLLNDDDDVELPTEDDDEADGDDEEEDEDE